MAVEPAGAPYGERRCQQRDCLLPPVVGCHYIDSEGRLCVTSWCDEHRSHAGVVPYCRRHAPLVAAAEAGRLTGPLPDVDVRSASLVGHVVQEVAPEIERVLGERARDHGETLDAQPLRREGQMSPRWVQGWTLGRDGRESVRVTIGAPERGAAVVSVQVNSETVRLQPPWIGHDALPSERRRFFDTLLGFVRERLERTAG